MELETYILMVLSAADGISTEAITFTVNLDDRAKVMSHHTGNMVTFTVDTGTEEKK